MKTKKTVLSAVLAALVCVATMIVKIPSPLKGYMNLGDCVVLLCGWLLSPPYAFLAAGIGSALADLFSGYAIYAPVTFAVKGVTALTAGVLFGLLHKKTGSLTAEIVGGIIAELIMVLGYYIFEGFMYGFVASAVNIPANAMQGLIGLIIGTILIKTFKNRILTYLK